MSKNPNDKADQNCKIKIFSNGFQINDGEFRAFNDPKNQAFMKELKSGY